ncbi:disulfide bond formation protein B [Dongshaea marina]|uniref:disulfide bond formation protein B n=1 Tax=Dongshaea marina TaxID=2047966 RepID=UPI000D3E1877|nr:disulfide bond formation protein B [Dongshaea marina]
MFDILTRPLNILALFLLSLVLIAGLVFQFILNELPCPLCLLQRVGFAAVMFGFLLNVVEGPRKRHYGLILVAALFGAAVALRQISLHVIPGTPPYGSAILGLHYYTWAFVIFSLTILGTAILLLLSTDEPVIAPQMGMIAKMVCLLAIISVLLTFIMTFIECGPYQCPDNPVSYWLLQEFL